MLSARKNPIGVKLMTHFNDANTAWKNHLVTIYPKWVFSFKACKRLWCNSKWKKVLFRKSHKQKSRDYTVCTPGKSLCYVVLLKIQISKQNWLNRNNWNMHRKSILLQTKSIFTTLKEAQILSKMMKICNEESISKVALLFTIYRNTWLIYTAKANNYFFVLDFK